MRIRRRTVELDRLSVARCQKRALLGLVHKARNTQFGLAHDFRRVRTSADFQRLVPLQTLATLWRDYWQPALIPHLDQAKRTGATWPGELAGMVVTSCATGKGDEYLPLTPRLLASHRLALRTALSLALGFRTDSPGHAALAQGRLCYVGGEPLLNSPGWLVGTPEKLAQFTILAKDQVSEIRVYVGPRLTAVLCMPRSAEAAATFRQALESSGAWLLNAFLPPEGPVGVEDPRHQKLRLIADTGSYLELVPVGELGKAQPIRHEVADAEPGVPYALAVTSPAGLWACISGARLCFESRDPPLFQLLETFDPSEGAAASAAPAPSRPHVLPSQPPHDSGVVTGQASKPESWKKAKRLVRRLLSDV